MNEDQAFEHFMKAMDASDLLVGIVVLGSQEDDDDGWDHWIMRGAIVSQRKTP